MIFDIITRGDKVYLVETKQGQAWDCCEMLEEAGFHDWRLCCFGEYENALEFDRWEIYQVGG